MTRDLIILGMSIYAALLTGYIYGGHVLNSKKPVPMATNSDMGVICDKWMDGIDLIGDGMPRSEDNSN